jgi:hypothetical protein
MWTYYNEKKWPSEQKAILESTFCKEFRRYMGKWFLIWLRKRNLKRIM